MSAGDESDAFNTVQLDEVRTVMIGDFRFKVGGRKNISRYTGKRKQLNKVRQGKYIDESDASYDKGDLSRVALSLLRDVV